MFAVDESGGTHVGTTPALDMTTCSSKVISRVILTASESDSEVLADIYPFTEKGRLLRDFLIEAGIYVTYLISVNHENTPMSTALLCRVPLPVPIGKTIRDVQTSRIALEELYKIPQYLSEFHVESSSVFHSESNALNRNRSWSNAARMELIAAFCASLDATALS